MLVLSLAFGLLAAAHARLMVALLWRRPRWRAALALLVPPLAPYWGWSERLRITSALWVFALVVYGLSLVAALT